MNEQSDQPQIMDNLSMPPGNIIPVLSYQDVALAVEWLCATFGFTERLRIGNHRCQLVLNGESVVVTTQNSGMDLSENKSQSVDFSIMVRVADVDEHFAHVESIVGNNLKPPETYPFGERQYSVVDIGGHTWTFTQSVKNVAPDAWGGKLLLDGDD